MAQIARIGDQVNAICSKHGQRTGTIETGSNKIFADGIGIARVGDTGTLTCLHRFRIISGSATTDIDGVKIARVNDSIEMPVDLNGGFFGNGNISSGSPTSDSA